MRRIIQAEGKIRSKQVGIPDTECSCKIERRLGQDIKKRISRVTDISPRRRKQVGNRDIGGGVDLHEIVKER